MTATSSEMPASPPAASLGGEFLEIIKTIVVALAIALVLRVIWFQPFTIPSGSMIPTLEVGDYIVATKYNYGWSRHSIPLSPPLFRGRILAHQPHRGDVIVFKDTKDNRTDYIKRLIGLPGDRVQVVDGVVYLNDHPLPQKQQPAQKGDEFSGVTRFKETMPGGPSYITQDLFSNGPADNTKVYVVPPGYYFFMGDNRDNSADSRFLKVMGGIEFVPAENLVGKAQFVLFSWREGASLFKPWTWFTHFQAGRMFRGVDVK